MQDKLTSIMKICQAPCSTNCYLHPLGPIQNWKFSSCDKRPMMTWESLHKQRKTRNSFLKTNKKNKTETHVTLQVLIEIPIRNELIDKRSLLFCYAITNKWNQMSMMDSADSVNLSPELPFSLATTSLQRLKCPHSTIRHGSLVNIPKSPLPYYVFAGKPVSDLRNLFVGKN